MQHEPYAQIVVNHTTRTAFVGGTYTRQSSALRGARRVTRRQGTDTVSILVFPAHQREDHLRMANEHADVMVFTDPA
ncbi:hypothetical protein ACFYXM_11135 [Streptomyces sp. NPDC002476]|uniref:hypothetical protein n=1 Tax=Streptomyces sp. NPDC002476 TaxID=3364648 RepID=UPI0036986E10